MGLFILNSSKSGICQFILDYHRDFPIPLKRFKVRKHKNLSRKVNFFHLVGIYQNLVFILQEIKGNDFD